MHLSDRRTAGVSTRRVEEPHVYLALDRRIKPVNGPVNTHDESRRP